MKDFQNGGGPGSDKCFVWEIKKTAYFWQFVGGPQKLPAQKPKMTELSTFSSISYCGALRIAPCKVRFYGRGHV